MGKLDESTACEMPKLIDIAGRPGHELSRLSSIMPTKGEPLKVSGNLATEVIGDPLRAVRSQITMTEMEESFEHDEPNHE